MVTDVAAIGSIARASRVLDALADKHGGASLTDIVTETSFTKTTAHRVLASLQSVNFVFQDPQTRTYRLATRLGELSRRAGMIDVAAMASRGMDRLAEITEDTVFLSVPEGPVSVCVARRVGAYPIRTLTLDRGDRRPLGVGAGALALYCALPEPTRRATAKVNLAWLDEYGFDAGSLELAHSEFRRTGYACNAGAVVSAMSAVGLPIVTRRGRAVAALAVGAINERMSADRIDRIILPALRAEATRLSQRMSDWEDRAEK